MKNFHLIVSIALLLLLQACASTKNAEDEVPLADDSMQLYQKAQKSIQNGNYNSAIEHLEKIDSLYPFGPYSHHAQLALIYSYYKARNSASAIATADRFIRQNANHKNLDYAYYMKGLVNFTDEVGFFKELLSF